LLRLGSEATFAPCERWRFGGERQRGAPEAASGKQCSNVTIGASLPVPLPLGKRKIPTLPAEAL